MLGEKEFESRGLISRNLLPIFSSENKLEWIMDSGILLNNSTQVVDRICDLIYGSGTLPVEVC
ncbi:hypothetical protein [Moritella yayanosii]|uniref:Uncharacterized protein n=1 Tax=Moritella yayanosii TaxID=69539 RepID=A0A330LQG8_9GAMM|nr:hypothetical protein [Moritella yayanosii]SQD78682.1 protein of unknown function, might belong to sensor histidine kinase [Moritella yayanosii]